MALDGGVFSDMIVGEMGWGASWEKGVGGISVLYFNRLKIISNRYHI